MQIRNSAFIIIICIIMGISFFTGIFFAPDMKKCKAIIHEECPICESCKECEDCDKLLQQQKKIYERSIEIIKTFGEKTTKEIDVNCLYNPSMKATARQREKVMDNNCFKNALNNIPEDTETVKYTLSKGVVIDRICGETTFGEINVKVEKSDPEGKTSKIYKTNFELENDIVKCEEKLKWQE